MAANINGSSLQNATPAIITYPFTVGVWVYPISNANATHFALASSANTTNFFIGGQSAGGAFLISAGDGSSTSATAGSITLNTWNFCLYRFISTTNRRMSVIQATGAPVHVQSTTSRNPTVDRAALGITPSSTSQFQYTGRLAEFWWAYGDIQIDNAQTQEPLLWKLAYAGPFSVPSIANNIIEYRSLRAGRVNNSPADSYYGRYGYQLWSVSGTVATAPHCPLPYWYAKPPSARKTFGPAAWESLIGLAAPAATTNRRRRLLVIG